MTDQEPIEDTHQFYSLQSLEEKKKKHWAANE
jgi:hypothetical protein